MTSQLPQRLTPWALGAVMVLIAASPGAAASCADVNQLVAQGLSVGQVAAALGASPRIVQTCLVPRSVVVPAGRVSGGPAGPPPLGAAGPPPLGAAGPPPLGAAGPPPLGAAGPPPLGAAGPAPFGAASQAHGGAAGTVKTR